MAKPWGGVRGGSEAKTKFVYLKPTSNFGPQLLFVLRTMFLMWGAGGGVGWPGPQMTPDPPPPSWGESSGNGLLGASTPMPPPPPKWVPARHPLKENGVDPAQPRTPYTPICGGVFRGPEALQP